MRVIAAALIVIGLFSPAQGACPHPPPKSAQQPVMDPYRVNYVTSAQLQRYCGLHAMPGNRGAVGCVSWRPNRGWWQIFIDGSMTPEQQACALTYEFAHMPPNFWTDPQAEMYVRGN